MTSTEKEPTWLAKAPPAARFFFLFSRAEYALKRAGFLRRDRQDAQASWQEFADVLSDKFFIAMKEDSEARELFLRPPRLQIRLSNGELGWSPAEPDFPCEPEGIRKLITYVTRVRNNIFHGGKTPYDTTRDDALIRAATFVLKSAIAQGPEEIGRAFREPT